MRSEDVPEPEQRQRAARGTEQIEKRINPKTGAARFYARYTEADGRRRHVKLGGTTIDEARKNLRAILARVDAGKVGREIATPEQKARARLTVRQLAELFCGKADGFTTGYVSNLRDAVQYRRQAWSVLECHVLDELGQRPAVEVKRADVIRLRDTLLADEKHPRTVQRALVQLSRLYNWAIERETIDTENPCRGVKKPRTTSKTDYYTEDEVARLLATSAQHLPGVHPLIAFAFYTGCRKGEIAALQVGDVDLDGARIVISRSWKQSARKSGKPVVVHVHPHLDAILRPLLEGRRHGDLVFPESHGGMRDKYRLWGLDEVVELAGVRRFASPWHAFRHAHATQLAAGGAGLTEIRDALGQSTLHMAATYTHLAAEHVKRRVLALPTLGPTTPAKVIPIGDAHQRKAPWPQLGHGAERVGPKSR